MSRYTWSITFTETSESGEAPRAKTVQGAADIDGEIDYSNQKLITLITDRFEFQLMEEARKHMSPPSGDFQEEAPTYIPSAKDYAPWTNIELTINGDWAELCSTKKHIQWSYSTASFQTSDWKKAYFSAEMEKVYDLYEYQKLLVLLGSMGAGASVLVALFYGITDYVVHSSTDWLAGCAIFLVVFIVIACLSCVAEKSGDTLKIKIKEQQEKGDAPPFPTVKVSEMSVLKNKTFSLSQFRPAPP